MDANLIKLLVDGGTVAILVYLLVMVLKTYAGTVNRITDLLEDEIKDEGHNKPLP